MNRRFFVRKHYTGDLIFDSKTEEYFEKIIADTPTLLEICRLLNALDKKNDLATERIESQCDTIRDLKKRLGELKEYE